MQRSIRIFGELSLVSERLREIIAEGGETCKREPHQYEMPECSFTHKKLKKIKHNSGEELSDENEDTLYKVESNVIMTSNSETNMGR